MSQATKKAVARHRQRLRRGGLVRLEIVVPKGDADHLRSVARALREASPSKALRFKQALSRLVAADLRELDFKAFLASAPLEDSDLARSIDHGRRLEF